MRKRLESELAALNRDMIRMAADVEKVIHEATNALCEGQQEAGETAINLEAEVERLELDIERRALRVLLEEQPVAGDLRLVSSALKIITDLKRIGAQAANIAGTALRHPNLSHSPQIPILREMGQTTAGMVGLATDAFVARDMAMANDVINADDAVDGAYRDVRKAIVELIKGEEQDPAAALHIFLIAKYYERIGDHTVNIAEWLRYAVTGETRYKR